MFGSAAGGTTGAAEGETGQRPDANNVFGDVFEDVSPAHVCTDSPCFLTRGLGPQLLRPEVERTAPLWAWLGAACGAGLGFIIANVPGTLVGAYAGNRLGAVRDAKGKSVAAVFSQLGGSQKAEVRFSEVSHPDPSHTHF